MASRTERDVEQEVLEWFHTTWDPDASLLEWRTQLVDSGGRFHRGHLNGMGSAFRRGQTELPIERSPGWWCRNTLGGGMSLAAPTIYDHASDELKSKYLRQTLTGELTWCQLFSEPGAGQILPACGAPQAAMETSG